MAHLGDLGTDIGTSLASQVRGACGDLVATLADLTKEPHCKDVISLLQEAYKSPAGDYLPGIPKIRSPQADVLTLSI